MGLPDTETRFDAIVSSIYDAALDVTRWKQALALVCAELDASAGGLSYYSFATGQFSQTWHNLEPEFENAYVSHYWQSDPWVARSHSLAPGEALFSSGLLAHRELQKTAFYNELCRPFDMQDLVGGVVARTDHDLVTFGVMRRTHPAEFRVDDSRFVQRVIPHLQRAHHVQKRLSTAEQDGRASWTAIEGLHLAVFLLDERGMIARANGSAERLLRSNGGIYCEGKALRAVSGRADRALRLLLSDPRGGSPIPLERSEGRPLIASAIPVSRGSSNLESASGAKLLILIDPDREPKQSSELFEAMFGLTPAESRVAILVGSGLAPKEAAQIIGTTWNTVRAQLKSVFAKTGTSGQSALVRLMSKLEALPRDE